jgi:hypothetical protein
VLSVAKKKEINMKQNTFSRLFTMGLVVLILFTVNCAKSHEYSNKEVIAKLTEYLNSRIHGSQYKIDPETTIVKPIGNNRYHITLKNSVFITDLTESVNLIYKYLSTTDDPYSEMDSGRMEEVTLIYGPGENFLRLLSIKGLSVEGDLSDAKGINKSSAFGGFETDKISISIGKITYQYPEGYDSGSTETMEHLKIRLSGATAKKDNISILLDIEKIGKVDTGKEDDALSSYLMDPNAKPPNLQTALDTGAAINDLNIQLGKMNILIKKNGGKLCDGTIENAAYLQFMKPDGTGQSFKFGHGIQLKNLRLSIPGEKKLQLLSSVKEFCYEFSIKNLSPGAAIAFLDLVRNSYTLRNQADSTGMNEYMTLVTKLIFQIMNAKTHMEIKIKPFKHYFGEMEAVVDLRLYNLMMGPILEITVDIIKVDDMLNRIKEANVFSDSMLKQIEQFLEKQAVKKENGDASIIYEMDIHQLRQMFLKGNPLVPPSTYNPFDFREH